MNSLLETVKEAGYELKKIEEPTIMVIIDGDIGDADYAERTTLITDPEEAKVVLSILSEHKNDKVDLYDEDPDWFEDLTYEHDVHFPSSPYDCIPAHNFGFKAYYMDSEQCFEIVL